MKKSRVVLALLVLSVSLSALELNTTETVSKSVKSDTLQASFSYEVKAKTTDEIKSSLNIVLSKIKADKTAQKSCKQTNYAILPKYIYKDGSSIDDGYSGNISFSCEFDDIASFNAIDGAIDERNGIKKVLNSLKWGIKSSQKASVKNELRSDLLNLAKKQSERFSDELGMKCEVDALTFQDAIFPVAFQSKVMMSADAPMAQDEDIFATANLR